MHQWRHISLFLWKINWEFLAYQLFYIIGRWPIWKISNIPASIFTIRSQSELNPLNFLFWLRGLFEILNLVISLVSSIHVDETLSPCLLWTLNFCLITRRERNYLRVISVKRRTRRTRREDLKRVLLPLHGGEFCHPLVSPVLAL